MSKLVSRLIVVGMCCIGLLSNRAAMRADDWPMLGRDGSRNSVSRELGGPISWELEERDGDRVVREARGVRWSAKLGSMTTSSPVVSGGLLWIGTNFDRATRTNAGSIGSVLKCFRVADGKEVFEFVSPQLAGGRIRDPGWMGLGSSPLIEGDRLWITTNRAIVLCFDIGPLLRGEGTPRELWKLDLIGMFDIHQHVPIMGPSRPCSIGATWKGRIFVTLNNGTEGFGDAVPKPDAPSLVCLDKNTGKVLWTDNSPGKNILVSQFASPTIAEVAGQTQVIVPQSDGWVRSFDPASGAILWEFDVNLKNSVFTLSGRGTRNSLLGCAVVADSRVYVASGMDTELGEGAGRLVCIDPTKRGDISSELAVDAEHKPLPRRRVQAVNLNDGEKAIPNPNSGLVWEYATNTKKFEESIHRTMNSVAVAKGLLILADRSGLVHCFDAKSGTRHWYYDTLADVFASPLIVDDKVYVADGDGDVAIFGLSPDPNVAMKKDASQRVPLAEINIGSEVFGSPMFSNGTLYIANHSELFAITGDKPMASKSESTEPRERTLRSVFVPTPQDVVEKMLELAEVKKTDVVFDLGSGDGRIVITAAKKYGCKAVGYEIDKELVELSRSKAEAAGVKSLVTIEAKDLFTADLQDADVIAVFLLPQQLEKLRPQFEKLKPGVRIVSHQFAIPDVAPQKTLKVKSDEDDVAHTLFLWTTPVKRAVNDKRGD